MQRVIHLFYWRVLIAHTPVPMLQGSIWLVQPAALTWRNPASASVRFPGTIKTHYYRGLIYLLRGGLDKGSA